MRTLHVDDSVRLVCSVPELLLPTGAIGIVCSTWFGRETYEVEFPELGERALVDGDCLELLEENDAELVK